MKKPRPSTPAPRPSRKPPVVTAEKTRCPSCTSTEREPYFGVVEHVIAGEHEGKPYTHVVWRRTRCKDCGQARSDRAYENRPAKKGERPA